MELFKILDKILQATKNFNCGSTLVTLAPSVLFFWNLWGLADTYIATFLQSTNSRRHGNTLIQCGHNWLKKLLTSILVWSGGQCWSEGLIRFLNTYTAVFLISINGCLESNYQMSQTTMDALEYSFKLIVCYSAVILIRWCYTHIHRNYYVNTRIRRLRRNRLYNWYMFVPERQINELGNPYDLMLLENNQPPEPQPTENSKRKKLTYTQSCDLLTNRMPILSKQIKKRRKSI